MLVLSLQDNFVNVHGLPLKEGQRYYICILVNVMLVLSLQDNFVNVHGLPLKEGQRYYICILVNVMLVLSLQDNFVNVHGLPLKEGQRYYMCILAHATDLEFEKFIQSLEQNSECSNGIVVDATPPTAGQVWVGSHLKHWRYQVFRPISDYMFLLSLL